MNLLRELLTLQAQGRPCALCTIVETIGSTPGKETMKMLVRDDGTFAGTVGGGCLEAEVHEAALESMRDERSRMLEFALNERDYPDSGLLCGGKVRVFVEPITEPNLYVFGGGHVSSAIARIASFAGFRVTVGDDREAFANPAAHPDADTTICRGFEEQVRALAPAENWFLVAVTRGHQEDGTVLKALAESGCRPRYLGMIGSRAKREVLFRRLREEGVTAEFLAGVRTPVGLAIGARTHEEIAVSVVAEMIQVRRLGAGSPAQAVPRNGEHAGPADIPWAGSFRGHDGVMQFFTAIGTNCEFLAFEPATFLADQDKVVVLGSERIKHKGTGREWETPWAHVFTVKDGKITGFREYTDTAVIVAACRG